MCTEEQTRIVSKQKFIICLTVILILIYEIIMLYLFSKTEALVPDEIWFYSITESMKTYTLKEIISIPNKLGYGSIYWIVLALLKTIERMRFFSFLCLSVLPISILILQKRVFKRKNIVILISMVILFSCPMTWFTGKIIGPELMGNAVGIIGTTLILFLVETCKNRKEISWNVLYIVGFGLLGVSAGIKLYNVVFVVFIGLYEIYPFIQKNVSYHKKIKLIVLKSFPMLLGFMLGFIIANPILLIDISAYIENLVVNRGFSIKNIYDILFLHRIEWDLVYSGGINHGIMSVVSLCIFFVMALLNKSDRRLMMSLLLSVLGCIVLVLLNSGGGFYCWYFLPMLFFLPLFCTSAEKSYFIAAFINIFLIGRYTWFQISNKWEQISNIENENVIVDCVNKAYAQYDGYSKHYFIDIGLQNYEMDVIFRLDSSDKQFIVISDRARHNKEIEQLYQKAVNEIENYHLIESKNHINILIHE